jgi:hypothetical protein
MYNEDEGDVTRQNMKVMQQSKTTRCNTKAQHQGDTKRWNKKWHNNAKQ